ncbi:peptide chain release factor N(5)-glutamine methyltransferase [Apilactobacillus kunkeei]|uniref:peptide chain release factor N(5)-glutamine methyltransferase n=1 Tax=Apilactobacillus kunkeei TaxID=148814 RepID=UPI00112E9C92|nr:peptide chain release factor N(5)-glutamine methyltransferase [Apilactobacillus kunkeei]MCK8626284.1 peptide chain release factor N(5)-glutamine methyltransferase [Apilactobacillus kunkeei]TPR53634.1 peptide chain release factor N(5)-glutamine methyltransferase [Apilactobacillus kunkeei]
MTNMTYFEAQKRASFLISEKNLDEETAKLFLMEMFGFDNTHLLLHYRDEMKQEDVKRYFAWIDQYLNGQPAQYIIGETDFYGNRFKVDDRVLIPRPETEELVEWLLTDFADQKDLKVLDMGTGSGAIAISISKEHPDWQVDAADISAKALQVAGLNNEMNKTNVRFIESDLFNAITEDYDVIISNPPYISEDEINYMDESVIEHEPKEALFAKNNGLFMYQKIADYIKIKKDTVHGSLYLEIGFKQTEAVTEIFTESIPGCEVASRKDFFGNPRMIRVMY